MSRHEYASRKVTEVAVEAKSYSASGDTGPLKGFGAFRTLVAQLAVSKVTGKNPTLDVFIEQTLDGVNWSPVATGQFQSAAAFKDVSKIGIDLVSTDIPFADVLRVRWEISRGAAFTFGVNWQFGL